MAETGPGRPPGYLARIPPCPRALVLGSVWLGKPPRGIPPLVETEAEMPCVPRGARYGVRASGKVSSPTEGSGQVGTARRSLLP